ncbi:MAG: MMPL family transporter, partial [Candidatus Izimaplasma sp.]|nr:MMPL family transporter [Candidatus Izimaplasma bacterium]
MKKYTDFIIKYKKLLAVLFLLINGLAIVGITKIELNTDFSIFSPDESIYEDRLNEVEDVFGELNQIIVLVEHSEFSDDVVADLRAVQAGFEEMDNVTYVQGVTPETFLMNNTQVPIENLTAAQIEQFYNNFGEFSPLSLQEGTYYSTFTIFITSDFGAEDIATIEEILDDVSYESYISGDTYNQLKVGDYIVSILMLLPPLSLIVILLVFLWQMGSIKPTLLSVLPAGVGSLWTFGIIGWLGNEVSILTAIVPIFIIVLGSAYGLHFVSHFLDSKKDGKDNVSSVSETLKLVGVPMTVTTLTSMVGFLSLLSMNTSSINDLAIFSALGILLAGVATWYVLPLVMVNNLKFKTKVKEKSKFDISIYLKKIWGIPSL